MRRPVRDVVAVCPRVRNDNDPQTIGRLTERRYFSFYVYAKWQPLKHSPESEKNPVRWLVYATGIDCCQYTAGPFLKNRAVTALSSLTRRIIGGR